MIIKKGIIRCVLKTESEVVTSICTVIEKIEGKYIETLFRRDSREISVNGTVVVSENTNDFKVYHDMTVENMLSDNDVYGELTWDTPLMEV